MAPISPADNSFVPRREFIRDKRPASSFSILALSGAALLRLYSFPTDAVSELRKHLDTAHLILNTRELIKDNFYELALDGKPWSNPKSMRTEKLLLEIIDILHHTGHNFLSTLDYGREQDDRIIMAFSRPSPSPSPPPHPQHPPLPGAASPHTFQSMSNDSFSVVSHPIKLLFAISFLSQNHLRVIAPPLHLTPAILQTVRGSWPRGVVSDKKVAENVYEFKLKGYRWFQEDTFATDSLRHILSMLRTLDGFGFTLLTSLSLNNRSRSKDLWIFTGLPQTAPLESQSSSPLGSRTELQAASATDKARERRRSFQTPAPSPTSANRPSHTRAATESSLAALSHKPSTIPSPISSKSGIVRKPAPRAQLPVSVAHSTGSNYNVNDDEMPSGHSVPSEELRVELQSDVGSAVDMTGIGTQKYGREPDTSVYQKAPSKFYSVSPGFTHHYPSMSASIMKASQPSESHRGDQTSSGRTEIPSPTREAAAPTISSRSRRPNAKATPQPVTPLLSPGAFRDSALSSTTGQTADMPSTWPGTGRGHTRSGRRSRSRDPEENVLPGTRNPPSAGSRETKEPGDYSDNLDAVLRPTHFRPEEQEVKVGVPELVHPRHRLARSGEATYVAEPPRVDTHRTKGADRGHPPPTKPTLDKRDGDSFKTPAEGWVLVNYGQPNGSSQSSTPTSRPSLRRKQSFPPTKLQKPPLVRSPYSTTDPRGAQTGSPVGSDHTKASSNPNNPSSMSAAAKAIVIIDAVQAKRKGTGDAPQSGFRKFFSLSRPDSPKSPVMETKVALSSGRGKGKMVESEDNGKKREETRERWHVKRMSKSNRRMSVD